MSAKYYDLYDLTFCVAVSEDGFWFVVASKKPPKTRICIPRIKQSSDHPLNEEIYIQKFDVKMVSAEVKVSKFLTERHTENFVSHLGSRLSGIAAEIDGIDPAKELKVEYGTSDGLYYECRRCL